MEDVGVAPGLPQDGGRSAATGPGPIRRIETGRPIRKNAILLPKNRTGRWTSSAISVVPPVPVDRGGWPAGIGAVDAVGVDRL